MLVLTRKLNEQIKIGDDITVTVVKMKGNTVRLGIVAPKDVRVTRSELLARIAAEASLPSPPEIAPPVAQPTRAAGAAGENWPTESERDISLEVAPQETHPLAVGPRSVSLAVRGAGPRQAPLAGLVRRRSALI